MAASMRAMAADATGVEMIEVPKPTPGPGQVRVKVFAAAVNPAEKRVIDGEFTGRFLHATAAPLIVGWDLAGAVDGVGDGVTDLADGTAVWGHLPYMPSTKQGTFAEWVTLDADSVAAKPDDVPHHVAAAAATPTMTSLQSLRDLGRLTDGDSVLVIGARGSVGSMAVGIAKRLGGHVTGVCRTKDVERVEELGSDVVIDRTLSNPLDAESAYDVVFDTPAVHSFARCARAMRPGGTYVTTLPDLALISGFVRALFSSKRCRFIKVRSRRADLELAGRWLSEGLDVPIDSRHDIADLDVALRRQEDPGRMGRVVIDVADGWVPREA